MPGEPLPSATWRNTMPDRKTVMISSTARDLPEHLQVGGYICIHRLLQDYFAELWETEHEGIE